MISGFIFFAFLAALFWAIGNVLDRIILTEHLTDPLQVTFFTGLFGALFASVIPAFAEVRIVEPAVLVAAAATGVLYIAPVYLYMKGLRREEVSRVTPIMNTTPIFAFVLGAIFLKEFFTFEKYLGMALAISGAVIVSSNRFGRDFFKAKANKAFWLITAGAALFGSYAVTTRWLLGFGGFWQIFFWQRMGGTIPLLLLLSKKELRKQIISNTRSFRDSKLSYLGLSELLNYLGVLSQTVALGIGAAALVETATSIQPALVLIIVLLLYKAGIGGLEEDLSRKAVAVKLASSLLIIAGIFLIQ